MKLFYSTFIDYVNNDKVFPDDFQNFVSFIQDNQFDKNPDEIRSLLHIIHKVFSYHKRNAIFSDKIYKILLYYSDKIRQTFSNLDIFRIFKNNKLILIFLFENKIITINEEIALLIVEKYGSNDSNFFYPELKPFLTDGKIKLLFQPDLTEEDFIKKRKEGVNDSYVCQLIRNDSIDEFKKFFDNQKSIEIDFTIPKSIFETNSFLIKSEPSYFEYAAFYNSTKIFNYLQEEEGNELIPSLWSYAIYGHNIELIELLKEKKIEPYDISYEECFIDTIRSHYNDIVKRLKIGENEERKLIKEQNFFLSYYNFDFIPNDFKEDDYELLLDSACQYDYVTIVKIILKSGKINLRELLKSKSISLSKLNKISFLFFE